MLWRGGRSGVLCWEDSGVERRGRSRRGVVVVDGPESETRWAERRDVALRGI